ncbi:RNase P subunit RPR2 [Salinarchaeum sp. Harcht-Bsk1]|uniref:ribonuclease P protein component 4 n=1 Tax=Salinarchaeum sp. Harcht-Bsk1 TaxID=1333523 RepID=UPI00034246A2|nr:RNase P subunit RPR2 [Salinarchaeum sp. Harcht-Bsk1]AGN02583.1 RNase P subunit RPR2 [Salinarchaeum sp. Harcht-Bsk1]
MSNAIAVERIQRLAALAADATADGDVERGRSYVRTARQLAQRQRLTLPKEFRRRTCDRCDAYLIPGTNARVRTQDGHVVVTCDCGEIARYPYD